MEFLFHTIGLDIAFVGVPFDCGTTYRSGTRFGPRQIRQESCMIKAYNKDTGRFISIHRVHAQFREFD